MRPETRLAALLVAALAALPVRGQSLDKQLIHSGWVARQAAAVMVDGTQLSSAGADFAGWMPARVPGTVLTTMMQNGLVPDPDFGMNNTLIPDIADVGPDYYTYWFATRFDTPAARPDDRLWLNFRGVNYRAEVFLNGRRLSLSPHVGMFLRRGYDITPWVRTDGGPNTLAVLVSPPDHPGREGGQAGDGQIARDVTMQFSAGWDWIQAVRDRNTGIWDEVSLTRTGPLRLLHPQVTTEVEGIRTPGGRQALATVRVSVEVENLSDAPQTAALSYTLDGQTLRTRATLAPRERRTVALPAATLRNPRLWWPNGMGRAELYPLSVDVADGRGEASDSHSMKIGLRTIATDKDPATGGRRFFVNGQKVFVRGGNYIASDWLLRLSRERYRTEVRFHKEMNLNMIRVWGGAIPERPEFYEVCDEMGMMVFQDFPVSGDGNGAWHDAAKRDSRDRRRQYPDDHSLLVASIEDEVRMLRNHPSLALWCGGNEWPAPDDVDTELRERVMPRLDPSRLFASYSTDTLFTRNTIGGVGDGPYGIQPVEWFFSYRSTPFNPELGSVGVPEAEAVRAFMTEEDFNDFPRPAAALPYQGPMPPRSTNVVWNYHKFSSYGSHIARYGMPGTAEEFTRIAQAVNYDQYRALMEGRASHMWEWYTGMLIWKTQNPWTALRGQMYDVRLDVNACLYGTRMGGEPLHIQRNAATGRVEVTNTTAFEREGLTATARVYATDGRLLDERSERLSVGASTVRELFEAPRGEGVYFLRLTLTGGDGPAGPSGTSAGNGGAAGSTGAADGTISDNTYWLTSAADGDLTALRRLPASGATHRTEFSRAADGGAEATVTLEGGGGVSFFNRVGVFSRSTGARILPVHYSDNYFTLFPGERKVVRLTLPATARQEDVEVRVAAWN